MKNSTVSCLLVSVSLLLTVDVVSRAQAVNGTRLSIGITSGPAGNVVEDYSAAIGEGNIMDFNGDTGSVHSLLVGFGNTFTGVYDAIAVGIDNDVLASHTSSIVGSYNRADSLFSGSVVGMLNFAWGAGYSSVVGCYNTVYSTSNSFVAGEGNVVQWGNVVGLIGQGFVGGSQFSPETVVGMYNVSSDLAKPARFTVANGVGAQTEQRSNAFVVCADGDVVITKRQGDILMGEFGN